MSSGSTITFTAFSDAEICNFDQHYFDNEKLAATESLNPTCV